VERVVAVSSECRRKRHPDRGGFGRGTGALARDEPFAAGFSVACVYRCMLLQYSHACRVSGLGLSNLEMGVA
jgi:hypothetical protein